MAPLPYNSTNVLTLLYSHNQWGTREIKFRSPTSVSPASLIEDVYTFLEDGLEALWVDDVSVTGATYQEAGADFSLPITVPAFAGANGASIPIEEVPRFVAVSSRGVSTGRESKLGVYFCGLPGLNNYRFTGGENSLVDAFRLAYTALANSGTLCSIGGDAMVVRTYANAGYNAYWQRKLRAS